MFATLGQILFMGRNQMNPACKVIFLFAVTLLSACTVTSDPVVDPSLDKSNYLYLRGTFSWWDLESEYRVKRHTETKYSAKVELQADGQTYEFKLADENWTSGNNCGFATPADETLELGIKANANCSAKYEPFRFKPEQSGRYRVFIDFADDAPRIWIELD